MISRFFAQLLLTQRPHAETETTKQHPHDQNDNRMSTIMKFVFLLLPHLFLAAAQDTSPNTTTSQPLICVRSDRINCYEKQQAKSIWNCLSAAELPACTCQCDSCDDPLITLVRDCASTSDSCSCLSAAAHSITCECSLSCG